jgi:hypothetical protein
MCNEDKKCEYATCKSDDKSKKCCVLCDSITTCKESNCQEMKEWKKYRMGG